MCSFDDDDDIVQIQVYFVVLLFIIPLKYSNFEFANGNIAFMSIWFDDNNNNNDN